MSFDPIAAALGLGAGALAGAAYFAALWQAVRRLPQTRRPLRALLLGALLRLSLLLAAAYLAASGGLSLLAGAVVGFLLSRTVALRRLGPRPGAAWKG